MNKRLIIACMNGAGAFRLLRSLGRGVISDTVEAVLRATGFTVRPERAGSLFFGQWDPNDPKRHRQWTGDLKILRGSLLARKSARGNQGKMEAWLRKNNDSAFSLLCVGHSTGAYNLHLILNRIAADPGLNFRRMTFISSDMNMAGTPPGVAKNRNTETFRIHDERIAVKAFYQDGFVGGMLPDPERVGESEQHGIPGLLHREIKRSPEVVAAIAGSIRGFIGGH